MEERDRRETMEKLSAGIAAIEQYIDEFSLRPQDPHVGIDDILRSPIIGRSAQEAIKCAIRLAKAEGAIEGIRFAQGEPAGIDVQTLRDTRAIRMQVAAGEDGVIRVIPEPVTVEGLIHRYANRSFFKSHPEFGKM